MKRKTLNDIVKQWSHFVLLTEGEVPQRMINGKLNLVISRSLGISQWVMSRISHSLSDSPCISYNFDKLRK